jgi:hypothetical protein
MTAAGRVSRHGPGERARVGRNPGVGHDGAPIPVWQSLEAFNQILGPPERHRVRIT